MKPLNIRNAESEMACFVAILVHKQTVCCFVKYRLELCVKTTHTYLVTCMQIADTGLHMLEYACLGPILASAILIAGMHCSGLTNANIKGGRRYHKDYIS